MIKNSLIFSVTAVIKGLLSFALIAVYTRMLSADAYGDYAIIIVLINVADVFGFMWLRQALMRNISDKTRKTDQAYFTNAAFLYAGIAAVTLILGAGLQLCGAFDKAVQSIIYELLALLIFTESISNLAILMARLRLRLGLFAILSIAKPLVALIAGAAFIYFGFGVAGAVWGLLISCSVAMLAGLLKLPDLRSLKPSLISKKTIKAILSFGLPLIAVLSIQSAIKATDRVLLEMLIGGDLTGLYAAAQDIPYKLLTILITSVHFAAYPLALKALEKGGKSACDKQLRINAAVIWGILLPAALAVATLAPQLTYVFLGQDFRSFANAYFPIFAAISTLNCAVQYYFVLSLSFAEKTKLLLIPFIIALLINAGIGYMYIPQISEQGAMLGSALAYGFLLIASLVIGGKIFPMPLPAIPLLKITLAACMMGAVIYCLHLTSSILSLAQGIIIGGLTYSAALIILNPLDIRQYLRQKLKP